jgi:hypothetical protein
MRCLPEFLVTTGVRLQEGASLLPEPPVPDPGDERSSRSHRAATTKGSKGREIRLPLRLLKRLNDYAEVERDIALGRYRQRQVWKRIDAPLMVADHDHRSLRRLEFSHPVRPL